MKTGEWIFSVLFMRSLSVVSTTVLWVGIITFLHSYPAVAFEANSDFAKGEQAMKKGLVREAEAAFQSALQKDPAHLPSYLAVLDLYYMQRRYEDSLTTLDRALEQYPNNAILWLRQGQMYFLVDQYEDATDAFDKAVSYASGDKNIIDQAVYYYKSMGNDASARFESRG